VGLNRAIVVIGPDEKRETGVLQAETEPPGTAEQIDGGRALGRTDPIAHRLQIQGIRCLGMRG
jgi:hypothetical protein